MRMCMSVCTEPYAIDAHFTLRDVVHAVTHTIPKATRSGSLDIIADFDKRN